MKSIYHIGLWLIVMLCLAGCVSPNSSDPAKAGAAAQSSQPGPIIPGQPAATRQSSYAEIKINRPELKPNDMVATINGRPYRWRQLQRPIEVPPGSVTIHVSHPYYENIKDETLTVAAGRSYPFPPANAWVNKPGALKIPLPPRNPKQTTVRMDGKTYSYADIKKGIPVFVGYRYKIEAIMHPAYEPIEAKSQFIGRESETLQRVNWKLKKIPLEITGLKPGSQVVIYTGSGYRTALLNKQASGTTLQAALTPEQDYTIAIAHANYQKIQIDYAFKLKNADKPLDIADKKWTLRTGTLFVFLPPQQPELAVVSLDGQAQKVNVQYAANRPAKPPFTALRKVGFGTHSVAVKHPLYQVMPPQNINMTGSPPAKRHGYLSQPAAQAVSINAFDGVDWDQFLKKGTFRLTGYAGMPADLQFELRDRANRPVLRSRTYRFENGMAEDSVAAGNYTLVIAHRQYQPVQLSLDVDFRKTTSVKIPALVPRTGVLDMAAFDPAGQMTVAVDGRDMTAHVQGRRLTLLIGPHRIHVSHNQHRPYEKAVDIMDGRTSSILSAAEWQRLERRGRVDLSGIYKSGDRVYLDDQLVPLPANRQIEAIIGEYRLNIRNSVYQDYQHRISIQENRTIPAPAQRLKKSLKIAVQGYQSIIYHNCEQARKQGNELSLILKEKQRQIALVLKSAGNDPIHDYCAYVLPFGAGRVDAADRMQHPDRLIAGGQPLQIDGAPEITAQKIFLFDAGGRHLQHLQLPQTVQGLREGAYVIRWGPNSRRFFYPYASFIYLEPDNSSVTEAIGSATAAGNYLAAYHLGRLAGDEDHMQQSWFNYCEAQTRQLSAASSEDQLNQVGLLWERVQFSDARRAQAQQYRRKISYLKDE